MSDLSIAKPANPNKSPSYPQRVHIRERAQWRDVLQGVQTRVDAAKVALDGMATGTARDRMERLYAQMLGARDQVADAARRMPMEVGELYEHDHHLMENAVEALERVFAKWEK